MAMDEANTLTADIDLQFLWDCAPDEEFGLVDVAHEYFGSQASIPQQVALAIALQGAPVFFRRKGRGRFQRAPLEQLQAGLAALERKQKELEQQSVWQQELVAGIFPEMLKSSAKQLLFSPDKDKLSLVVCVPKSKKLIGLANNVTLLASKLVPKLKTASKPSVFMASI